MSALDYFLKANLYGLLFAGCYALFLRRHTFLNLNRAYLLLSAVLLLSLPLASLPTETANAIPIPTGVMARPVSVVATAPVEPSGPDWTLLGAWAYGLIAVGLVLRLAIQTDRLIRLIRQSERQGRDGYVLVLPRDQTTPTFSFFRYVVLNPADVHNDLILNHELIHVRQYHSADVLGLALLRAVFWPVLALVFVERALRHVHEDLADSQASGYQPNYARFLVDYTFGVRPDVLTNGFFNPSLLKQRIRMLHQRATNRWALGKYALVLPLALGLLAMTTAREEIAAVVNRGTDDKITVSGRVTSATARKPLPGATVVVVGTNRGTNADAEGRYQISVSPKEVLVFSFVGFRTQEVKPNGRTIVNVLLTQTANQLSKLEVYGYGPDPKSDTVSAGSVRPSADHKEGDVFISVEQNPEYPGGTDAMKEYFQRNMRYPIKAIRAGIQGDVLVKFIITPDGSIDDVFVEQGIGGGCNEEAIRLIQGMPKWNPGKQNGKPVAVMYNLPIQFALEKKEDKRTGQVEPTHDPKNDILDNSPNARFALYDDLGSKRFAHPDSDPVTRSGPDQQPGQYEPVFKPTSSPIGEFPTTRAKDFPNQPQLNMVKVTVPATIHIRGAGPLGQLGEEPLYLLNGEEISAEVMKSLNSRTIESITVLKDASARVYGEKGKNGVVIITTKKP